MPILKSKTACKTKSFSVRLPVQMLDDLDALKQEADSRGLLFDAQEIIVRALTSAIRSARVELSGIGLPRSE